MQVRRTALSILALVAVGCGATQASPTTLRQSVTQGPTSPGSSPSTSPGTTEEPASALEGTWSTAETTCEQQNAALANAGFSNADLELGGWDETTCGGMMHGSQFTIRFADERLVILQDDVVGWDGTFRIVDSSTFEAGDLGSLYITSEYAIDGDQLTLDMVRDDYPTSSQAELLGDQIAGTVIYETAPFMRAP